MATIRPSETTALLFDAETTNLERATSRGSVPGHDPTDEQEILDKGAEFETSWNHEIKLLFKYSIPLLGTYMLQYSYSMVTVFVAGRLGTPELGAASLASMTTNITGLCVYEGLATSLDTLCSQAYGAGKKQLVGLHVQRMMALLLVATIPICALWICSPWILVHLVPERELAELAGDFIRIYLIGTPGYGMFEAGKRFTQAQGNFSASLIPVLVCAPLNLLWNWLFVFHFKLGFRGAAMAVALSNTLQPLVFLVYVNLFAAETLECWPKFSVKKCFQNWGPMVQLSWPGVVMILAEWLAFDILTFSASYLSEESLAAQSVLMTICVTMYHIPLPFSIASSTRFGNLIGHGALTAARQVWKLYYVVFFCIGLFDIILMISLRYIVAQVFTDDPAVQSIIVSTAPLVSGMQMFDALTALTNGLLRGLARQRVGGIVNFAVYYLFSIPLSMLLTFGPPHLGLWGLWTGPTLGLGLVSLTLVIYMRTTDWRKAIEEARARSE